MADSSLIDNALIAKLGSDLALLGLCPNGVFYAEAPPGATRFVIVSLAEENDVPLLAPTRAFEDGLYLIKAVMLSTTNGNIQAAAARIDALLENASLTVNGYTTAGIYRESRVRITEVDDLDASIRWYHRGGYYRVLMAGSP